MANDAQKMLIGSATTDVAEYVQVTGDSTYRVTRYMGGGHVPEPVTTTANLTLTAAEHAGRTVVVNKADGAAITLPAATGTGAVYTVVIGTTVTSNSTTIKAASASDSFVGRADIAADGETFRASSGDDTVTMNGTTTGGIAGDTVTVTDIASGTFLVHMAGNASGTEATPFSATVS